MTWQLGTPSAFWKRINYYTPQFLHGGYVPWVPAKLSVIRDTLTRAVQKRLMVFFFQRCLLFLWGSLLSFYDIE